MRWICSNSFRDQYAQAFHILENATIDLDFSKNPIVTVYPNGSQKYPLVLPEHDGYFYELKDFVEGVEKGRGSGVVTGHSSADAVALCLLEIESAKEAKEKEFK